MRERQGALELAAAEVDPEEPFGHGAAAIRFYAFVANLWHSDDRCLNSRGNQFRLASGSNSRWY